MSATEKFGLLPKLPDGTVIDSYKAASRLMRVYRVGGGYVKLLIGGLRKKY